MENKKIIDMEIGSQAFSKDGNWQVIRRFKVIEKEKQPKYSYEVNTMVDLMKMHHNYSKVGEILGISDNAVKKRFIRLGYPDNIKDLIKVLE